jgi:RNA polymerase sigma-70 factor (sigma-E family)
VGAQSDEDELSFELFVHRHARELLLLAVGLTGHAQDGEDLLQAALMRVAAKWGKGAEQHPVAYTRTVLTRLSVDRWRSSRRRPRLVLVSDLPDVGESAADQAGDMLLLSALRELPRRQRAVVALRYLEDLSEQQTAELLGISVGTVKSTASKALARLRVSEPVAREAGR